MPLPANTMRAATLASPKPKTLLEICRLFITLLLLTAGQIT
jgi:hypothetical protein